MRSFSKIIFLVLLMSIGSLAQADILLDPYLSILISGNTETSGTSTKLKSGNVIGARVGYSMLGLGLGVDYGMGSVVADTTPEATGKINDLGFFVSYSFPILVRGYFVYYPTSAKTVDTAKSTGTATKIGVGYTGLPFVTLNLEVWTATYTKVETGGASLSTDSKDTVTFLSASLPFNF